MFRTCRFANRCFVFLALFFACSPVFAVRRRPRKSTLRRLLRGSHTTSTPDGSSSSRTRPGRKIRISTTRNGTRSARRTLTTTWTASMKLSADEAARQILYMGPACYRKHFKLPAGAKGNKVFIEFEGMRQAAGFFVNGKAVGKYENGVTPCGIDITDAVFFGDKENVLTVKITNDTNYKEEATGIGFQWGSQRFQSQLRRAEPQRLAAHHRQGIPDASPCSKIFKTTAHTFTPPISTSRPKQPR